MWVRFPPGILDEVNSRAEREKSERNWNNPRSTFTKSARARDSSPTSSTISVHVYEVRRTGENQSYPLILCHETKTQLCQQGSFDSCFCVRNFHQHCCARESQARSPDGGKSAELRMESGFPSPDRWQVCRDHRTGSPL